jgi:hypothetical protein
LKIEEQGAFLEILNNTGIHVDLKVSVLVEMIIYCYYCHNCLEVLETLYVLNLIDHARG